ncbi:hypothetical protein [Mobiluncus sp.]|uniref:hypothetical protein n=1 Tax=Mobiluncus sp. TaxID=47293 RepID=UPI002A9196C5|nr:hypothetical protein [Mobiluncus sp.]MDY6076525.1 hypothetical protein [Mobiluncus sp.]
MEAKIYKTLSRIVGIVLIVLGIGAFGGGVFDHSFIADQLKAQGITMPSQQEIENSTTDKGGQYAPEDVAALKPFYGQSMTTGAQAKAFAEHYMGVHMKGSAARAGVPEELQTFNGIGEYSTQFEDKVWEQLKADDPTLTDDMRRGKMAEITKAKDVDPKIAEDVAKIGELANLKNNTFFQGNMIQGTLLNAYGWSMIGTVAKAAGIGLAVVGLILLIVPSLVKGKKVEA